MIRNAFGDEGRPALIEDRHPPLLLYSMGHYNLVAYRGRFFAIPQSLGPIDLEREDVSGKPGVMVASDLQPLEQRLLEAGVAEAGHAAAGFGGTLETVAQ